MSFADSTDCNENDICYAFRGAEHENQGAKFRKPTVFEIRFFESYTWKTRILRETWGKKWEPGVVGWGKWGGKIGERGGSCRGKRRVWGIFFEARNRINYIPPAFICVILQKCGRQMGYSWDTVIFWIWPRRARMLSLSCFCCWAATGDAKIQRGWTFALPSVTYLASDNTSNQGASRAQLQLPLQTEIWCNVDIASARTVTKEETYVHSIPRNPSPIPRRGTSWLKYGPSWKLAQYFLCILSTAGDILIHMTSTLKYFFHACLHVFIFNCTIVSPA